MDISTIIVNYNAGETLQQCVKALLKSREPTTITVVDNASSDGSAVSLQSFYGNHPNVEFLFNSSNLGFAPAVNAVAREANTDWILILNPDCILGRDALSRLKAALENDDRAGLAGAAVNDEYGQLQRATVRRFPDPWRSLMTASGLWRLGRWVPAFHGVEIQPAENLEDTQICDAVSGACMLLRRSALEEVGYLDEAYAMHCEDLDLMYRLKQKGWHCLYVPTAECVHMQGLSSRSRPTWVHFQKHRGMARFFRKFQAETKPFPVRWLVYAGIWLRFMILWPQTLIKR
ncbi:MAG: glycosyltransferase family 2 protein [Gammaproteobacteria bacterium]|nr:glycosyltransferase family 2 protein [Gammaproteobacteria bacterium]MBT8076138.1 glycosyltransferase family 2 protein [Gammaproteobacteria bacterium]NNK97912.1 glycosyltransferase family 2 protein [Xanthomonadales bacterium]